MGTVKKGKNRHGGNPPYMPPWIYTVLGRRYFKVDEKKRRLWKSKPPLHRRVKMCLLYDGFFSFAVVRQINIWNYNSLMVAVIDILRIRFAGAYTAAIAAIETNRRITPKEIIGNCHTADGKCPAIRKSYSDLLSGKPIAQPTTHPKTAYRTIA